MVKSYLIPCAICAQSVRDDEKLVFCPDCKQIYHQKCWEEKGNECKIKGCHGDTKIITTLIEKTILNNLKLHTGLRSECPNCNTSILILYRYCPSCGSEANPPSIQNSFRFFSILKFFHNQKQRLILLLSFLVFLVFCLVPWISGLGNPTQGNPPPSQTKVSYFTQTPPFTPTKERKPTATVIPTKRPTNTHLPMQIILEPIPSSYKCPDKNKIQLQVGAQAVIGEYDVNLREQPVVPDDYYANIVLVLRKGDELQIIDGPVCSHDGSWWKVKTKSGKIGWSREQSSVGILLIRTDK